MSKRASLAACQPRSSNRGGRICCATGCLAEKAISQQHKFTCRLKFLLLGVFFGGVAVSAGRSPRVCFVPGQSGGRGVCSLGRCISSDASWVEEFSPGFLISLHFLRLC